MVVMARKKATEPADDYSPVVLTFRCDGELAAAFRKFIASQRVPPSKTDVMIVALQDFLRAEGHYPLKDSD